MFRHRRNLCVGAAMKTGVKASPENGADIIVKMDADGQHTLLKFLENLFTVLLKKKRK